jgi:hypothetical protein
LFPFAAAVLVDLMRLVFLDSVMCKEDARPRDPAPTCPNPVEIIEINEIDIKLY